MKIYQIIETPWAPYSVMFSCDGRNLAIGGGTWYGNGGLILYSLDQSRSEVFPLGDVTKNLHYSTLVCVFQTIIGTLLHQLGHQDTTTVQH